MGITTRQNRRRMTALCLATLIAGLATGCMKNKTLIRVNPDGTGTILMSCVYSPKVKIMMDQMMTQMEAQMKAQMQAQGLPQGTEFSMKDKMPKDPLCSEDTIKGMGRQFGSGVRFVKSKKIQPKGGGNGFVALFEFDDINEVFVNMNAGASQGMSMSMAPSPGGAAALPPVKRGKDAIQFELTKGPTSTLTVRLPKMPEADTKPASTPAPPPPGAGANPLAMAMPMLMAGSNPFGLTGTENQVELAQKMCKGMRMSIFVQVNGDVAKTNASHPADGKKNRFTLLDADMGKMVSSPAFEKAVDQNPGMMMGQGGMDMFADCPGFTRETKEEVTIAFRGGASK